MNTLSKFSSAEELRGFVIQCDLQGKITEVIYNDLRLKGLDQNRLLPTIVSKDSFKKALDFIPTIRKEKYLFGWELNVLIDHQVNLLKFSGVLLDENHILILAFNTADDILKYYEDLMTVNSQHTNKMRLLLKETINQAFEKYNRTFLEQFSELNNELTNLQRELNKKNKELEMYSQELFYKNERLLNLQNKLNNEMEKGQRLHNLLLPSNFSHYDDFTFAVHYQPLYALGGDFYNIIELNNHLLVYLSDVTGHGLDGAMINIFVREAINSYLISEKENLNTDDFSLKDLIRHLIQRYQHEKFPDDYFICIAIMLINKNTKTIQYCNAGQHISPLVITNSGEVFEIGDSDLPISKAVDPNLYEIVEEELHLSPNDTLLLSTDGLIEEKSKDGRYGKERLINLLQTHYKQSPLELVELINNDFFRFIEHNEETDDITYMIIKREEV